MKFARDLPSTAVAVALGASAAVMAVWLLWTLTAWLGTFVELEVVLWCIAGLFFAVALGSALAAGRLWDERNELRATNDLLQAKCLELRTELADARRRELQGRWSP